MTIVKHVADQLIQQSPTCGEMREILQHADDDRVNIAMALDIKPTHPHYHLGFEEIYFVLDGNLELRLFDPDNRREWTEQLGPNELLVIKPRVHHGIIEASAKNRLVVITVPGFDPTDEHLSGVLADPTRAAR